MQSLFPARPGGSGSQNGTTLVSFNAGKCNLAERSGGKFLVTPDPRRGTVSLVRTSDGLIHFRWNDRGTGGVEEPRIIFPDEVQFKRVKTGRDFDRVFMLKYLVGHQRMMFWMQDKSSEKDDEFCEKINLYANNSAAAAEAAAAITAAAAPAAGAAGGRGPAGMEAAWMQMLGIPPGTQGLNDFAMGGAGLDAQPAVPPPSAVPAATPAGLTANLDFSSLLGQLGAASIPPPAPASQSTAAGEGSLGGLGSIPRQRPLALQDIITPEGVLRSGVLDDQEVRDLLLAQMPEGQRTEDALRETLHGPQFRQALGALSEALQSDNFNSIMANLSIDPTPGTPYLIQNDGVRAFLASFRAQFPPTVASVAPSAADAAAAADAAMDTDSGAAGASGASGSEGGPSGDPSGGSEAEASGSSGSSE